MVCCYHDDDGCGFSPSLCSIDPLSEAQHKETGYYTLYLHARRHIHELSTKSLDEATKWTIALQDAIDACQSIQTLTERLILSLIVSFRLF